MPAAYRSKKSTAANAVDTFKTVQEVLRPVSNLSEVEMTHFNRVVTSREASTWSPHDLSIATQLAVTMRRFDELQQQLDSDGLCIENAKGTPVAHPLLSASMQMASTIQALSRTLGLSASQKGLGGAPQASRNQADMEARRIIERAAADELLA